MTGHDVIALAQLQSEEDYDTPTWLKYINACPDDLTPVIKLLDKKENIAITPTEGNASVLIADDDDLVNAHSILAVYFAPTDVSPKQLRRLPFGDNASEGWKLTAESILYQNIGTTAGTSRVDFYRRLRPLANVDKDLAADAGLPVEYHNLVVLFCIAKSQQKEEELEDANNAYAEYQIGKKQLFLTRTWEMEPHMRKHIKKARIAAILGASGSM